MSCTQKQSQKSVFTWIQRASCVRVQSACLFLVLLLGTIYANPEQERRLITHVVSCIQKAQKHRSKLNKKVLSIPGMSSPIVRHFLNNLCSLEGGRYLEIGCWQGSTLIAATYKNEATLAEVIAIDNWSEFDGPKKEFHKNVATYIPNAPLRFYEMDCFSLNKEQTFPHLINLYFYDGAHQEIDQEKAFTYYNSILDDVFVAVVDDWNMEQVREGTFSAFAQLNYTVLFEQEIFTKGNGDMDSWWNGMYIAVIKKEPSPSAIPNFDF